jgi:cytosine/adenosine deaminase-related metal-dependent hydrolase
MALVLLGTVTTFDPELPVAADAAVYVDEDGRIEALQPAGAAPPAGYEDARRVRTGGVIYPGLIDLHNHLAYNHRPLWAPPGRTAPFTSRDQWPRLPAYATDVRQPTLALTQVASKALLKFVEVKAVVGGVTAVQGSAVLSRPFEGFLVRNVEYETFATGERSVFQSVRRLAGEAFESARDHMVAGDAFIYHLAEGTSPTLLREYDELRANDCLQPQLVAVHATALGEAQYAEWGAHHSSVVWSPFSNLWLYRGTSEVVSARDRGIRVCLGADWSPSGSKHLLGELKVAHLWNHHPKGLDGAFSDQELCEMVTANPADAVGWSDHVGRVKPGLLADLVVVNARRPDPYDNLIRATERDVRLVLVGGRPVYGGVGLMRQAGARDPDRVVVAGRPRSVALVDHDVQDADLRWGEVVAALEAVRADPPGAHAALLATVGDDEEPFRIFPDDPGGEPAVTLTAADLGEVVIPPLDTLAHDAAYLAAVRAAPIHDGVLDGLAAYYG